ncbi:hypothetical protein [Clostridium neonatale]|uniref:hypothetical protein n=1 Tax=Clostridium neonatale TaxID=137838 RepID=UPI00291B5E7C|nr:hypothetical protein [Clostridium neonatale]CAI3206524.1 hypothetical protein CNEO2_520023 [Clostridium neonatale]CAI3210638.1 hypothetical protein CNEO2_440022 [Clostridium neonatale]CAI3676575.1 hypothetical protein CNEO4_540022 [Clostridium neonatale]
MIKQKWILKKILPNNLSVSTTDDGHTYDPVCKIQDTLDELYNNRVIFEKPSRKILLLDEWFQVVYIDKIKFHIVSQFGTTSFISHDCNGIKYIKEIELKLNCN